MSEAIIKGGLYQNAHGVWVNGKGEPVDIKGIDADLRRKYKIKEVKQVEENPEKEGK